MNNLVFIVSDDLTNVNNLYKIVCKVICVRRDIL